MTKKNRISEVLLAYLTNNYPSACCALSYTGPYECLVAIILSAQTSDRSVNEVTPRLFKDFPSVAALAAAKPSAVEKDIRRLGLYHSKTRNLIEMAHEVTNSYDGVIPLQKDLLLGLPGVGNKTAGVFLAEIAQVPALPVDTHVATIAIRLGYAKEGDGPSLIEKQMEKSFPRERWILLHHQLIAFGREICSARKPLCSRCGMRELCPYFKKNSSMTGK
jgi:endonuclease III